MKELNFYLKTTASAYKCFQKPYQDVHLLNWVTCNFDCGVMWFGTNLGRSSGLTAGPTVRWFSFPVLALHGIKRCLGPSYFWWL